MNGLLKKDKQWNWSTDCQNAVEKLQNTNFCVCTGDFETSLEIILAAVACVYGIGAVLLRKNGRNPVVTHVSRTLLLAERNYIQTEKEEFEVIFTKIIPQNVRR